MFVNKPVSICQKRSGKSPLNATYAQNFKHENFSDTR